MVKLNEIAVLCVEHLMETGYDDCDAYRYASDIMKSVDVSLLMKNEIIKDNFRVNYDF